MRSLRETASSASIGSDLLADRAIADGGMQQALRASRAYAVALEEQSRCDRRRATHAVLALAATACLIAGSILAISGRTL